MDYPMKPILFQRCKLEKDDFDGVGGNKIGKTLVAHGSICQNFDWRMEARGWLDMDVTGGNV